MRRALISLSVCVFAVVPLQGRAQTAWTPFRAMSFVRGDRIIRLAMIFVPVHLHGVTGDGWMQLDLGSRTSIIYGKTIERIAGAAFPLNRRKGEVTIAGRVGSYRFADETAIVYRDLDEGDIGGKPVYGEIGASFFIRRILALDFVRDRFVIANSKTELPSQAHGAAATQLVFPEAGPYRNRVLVPVVLRGVAYRNVMYDTGSSGFVLVLTHSAWQIGTGRSEYDRRNVVIDVPAFGQMVTMVGAPMLGAMRIGAVTITDPFVYAIRNNPSGAERVSPEEGILGNGAFSGCIVVVDIPDGIFGVKRLR